MYDVRSPLFQDSQPSHSTVFPLKTTCSPQCLLPAPLPPHALLPHTAPVRNRRPNTLSIRATRQPTRRIDTRVSPFGFPLLDVYSSLVFVADGSSILSYADEKLELDADKEESAVCSPATDVPRASKRSMFGFMTRRGTSTNSSSGTFSPLVGYVPHRLLYALMSSLPSASRLALPGDCPTPRARLRQTQSSKRLESKRPDILFSTGLLMRFASSRPSPCREGR
jgi:hypothetical protein